MSIVVGVVSHAVRPTSRLPATSGVDVRIRINASRGGDTPWLGFAANHNRLIAEAAGEDWYVCLNPDVEISADRIKRLVEAGENAGCDVVAPLFRTPWGIGGLPQPELPGPATWLREAVRGAGGNPIEPGHGGMASSAWVSGSCMALRLGSVEYRFDERYFMYFEDVELCRTVRLAGGRVGVCADLVVEHDSGWHPSDPLRWRRGVEFARSALLFAQQRGSSRALMRACGAIRFGSRLCAPGRTPPERTTARAITRGFVQLGTAAGLAELAAQHNAARP